MRPKRPLLLYCADEGIMSLYSFMLGTRLHIRAVPLPQLDCVLPSVKNESNNDPILLLLFTGEASEPGLDALHEVAQLSPFPTLIICPPSSAGHAVAPPIQNAELVKHIATALRRRSGIAPIRHDVVPLKRCFVCTSEQYHLMKDADASFALAPNKQTCGWFVSETA